MVQTEVIRLANGKYVTTFDNLVVPCSTDFACPTFESVCLLESEAKWINSSHCSCPTYLGRTGTDCKSLNAGGVAVAVVQCITLAICSFVVCKFSFYLYLLIKHKVKINFNAIQTTYFTLFISCSSLLMYMSISTERSLGQAQSSTETDGADRLPNLEIFFIATVFIYFLFFVQSALNISVAWMEVARMSTHMKNTVSKNLDHYGRYVYLFDLCMTIICIILLALKLSYAMTLLLGLVVLLVVIPTYLYGAYRILKVMKFLDSTIHTLQNDFKAKEEHSETVFKKQIHDIYKTSVAIVVIALLNIAFLFAVFMMDASNYTGNPPDFPTGYLVYRIGGQLIPSFGYLVFDSYIQSRLLAKVPGYNVPSMSSPTVTSHVSNKKG